MFIHHIDVHVRALAGPRRIFDQLMPALGFSQIKSDEEYAGYHMPGVRQPFFGLNLDAAHQPGSMRVAFAANSRAHVDELARLVIESGAAHTLEGPEFCPEYSADYYALFFEDDSGNKYEICHRDS